MRKYPVLHSRSGILIWTKGRNCLDHLDHIVVDTADFRWLVGESGFSDGNFEFLLLRLGDLCWVMI